MSNLESLKTELSKIEAEKLDRIKNLSSYDSAVNEGGEGYSAKDDIDEEYAPLIMELTTKIRDAEFEAEWTLDVFETRRATYNDAVKSGKYKHAHQIEQAVGITTRDLLRAKKLLGV